MTKEPTLNAEQLIAKANQSFEFADAGGFDKPTESSERYCITEVCTEFNGHPVRVKFNESDSNPAAYRYNVTVYDAETDEPLTTGNGGASWEDAFSIVQWSKLVHHWG